MGVCARPPRVSVWVDVWACVPGLLECVGGCVGVPGLLE